jgi:hypothetical protein
MAATISQATLTDDEQISIEAHELLLAPTLELEQARRRAIRTIIHVAKYGILSADQYFTRSIFPLGTAAWINAVVFVQHVEYLRLISILDQTVSKTVRRYRCRRDREQH